MKNRLGVRNWITLILIGLFGQFAWTIENMYFNVFLYNTISTDPGYIAAMVGWSAAAATVTTLLWAAQYKRAGCMVSLHNRPLPHRLYLDVQILLREERQNS